MRPLGAGFTLIGLLACSAVADAAALGYSLGGGYVQDYRSGDFIRFGATGFTTVSVDWRWIPRLAFRASVGYLRYSGPAPVSYSTGFGPSPGLVTWGASWFPASVGIVGHLRGEGATPFVEVSPALVWTHWFVHGGFGDSEFTEMVPGVRAGLGMHLPLSSRLALDAGMLYLWSASGRIRSEGVRVLAARERFSGLNQATPFAQLTLSR
jgi:hypothetical protein